ncbi:MAG: hypothetical protein WD512_16315 [Candidatus Paceibacterota bacterium]
MPYVNNSYTSSYTAGLVGPASNTYTTLGGYNSCTGAIRAPVPMTSVSGYYIVPSYSSPGYDTLMHGSDNCSTGANYFQIGKAYGNGGNACGGCNNTKYMVSMC